MKRLFVCKANVGRSQAAMELYRQRGGQADSAGTRVNKPGTTLAERPSAATIVQVMRDDYSIDMIHNIRTQLTRSGTKGYDSIIMMAQTETVPKWAFKDHRVTFWDIDDAKGFGTSATRTIVHKIKSKVDTLPL